MTPPKESQKIPALDKPAEGLAVSFKRPDGQWGVRLGGNTPDFWTTCIDEETANKECDRINQVINSIVKPLREKAERFGKELIAEQGRHARALEAISETKSRALKGK